MKKNLKSNRERRVIMPRIDSPESIALALVFIFACILAVLKIG